MLIQVSNTDIVVLLYILLGDSYINEFLNIYRILVMGTSEKLGVNIHVDQLMDTIASSCGNLERLELR